MLPPQEQPAACRLGWGGKPPHGPRTAAAGDEPRQILAELRQVSLVDVVLPTRTGLTIGERCVSRPTEHQAIVLQRLGLALATSIEIAGL